MTAFNVVKNLRQAFANRSLTRHAAEGDVRVHADAERRIFVVLDPRLSKTVLGSRLVENENYFAAPLAQLTQRGASLSHVAAYFSNSPLFKEGADHRALRALYQPLIDHACEVLRQHLPLMVKDATRRCSAGVSALQFAERLVQLAFALAIRDITGVSLRSALRALRRRESVFYFHFHPGRHHALERALVELERGRRPASPAAAADAAVRWDVAQSLIVMGVDPCVSAVCAAVVEDCPGNFGVAINRYAPTSFVSRRCTGSFSLQNHSVEPGDLLYLSLVRPVASDFEQEPQLHRHGPTIAFGAGPHLCIGRPFALAVSEIAEQIFRGLGSGQIRSQRLVIRGDGAFLSFEDEAGDKLRAFTGGGVAAS